ncbi:unnamed protein product [Heligmosomoides polygyrus]|uniref:H15 domain-containing protein n=1 Tax=Heligmosomoides polygyrus TaxID=6339 RepID=A0A183G5M1_HELPZ|nr:unnamed protein product [Heligmosomoides polygyrus]
MSAAAIASPKAAKASKPKTAVKKVASHPTYSAMIRKSVSELKDKSGSSKAAILKYMLAHYKLGDNVTKINSQLRLALKRGVVKGDLKQVKGSGASGSFKLGEKKAAAPAKKSIAKKPAGAKKPKSPKKAVAAKKPKAEKKAKSPKKAKAPKAKSAAKKPKAAKSTKPKAAKPKASKPKAVKKVKA